MRRGTIISGFLALAMVSLAPQSSESSVLLRHRFKMGEVRRYRCEMQTLRQSEGNNWESRVVMIEEERCHEVFKGIADVSYRAIAMAVQDLEDGVEVYSGTDRLALDVASDFERKALGEKIGLGEGLRYLIDKDMQVLAVSLPESLSLSERHRLDESYRRALNSRYRSFFPIAPIKPGDRWESEIPFDEGFWAKHEHVSRDDYRVSARHLGTEVMRGHRCIKLELKIDLASGREVIIRRGSHDRSIIENLKANSEVWFDLAEGAPILERSRLDASIRREIKIGSEELKRISFQVRQRIETTLEEPGATADVAILAPRVNSMELQEAE